MHLDRLLGDVEEVCNSLVRKPLDNQRHHVALSRREGGEAPLGIAVLSVVGQNGLMPAKPFAEQLRAVMRAHVLCLLDDVEGSAAHLEVESLPPELRVPVIAKRDRYERGIRGLVAAGVDAGEFAPCDPGLVTRAMLGAINWTTRWFRADGPRSAASVADDVAAYLVRGLLNEPPKEDS